MIAGQGDSEIAGLPTAAGAVAVAGSRPDIAGPDVTVCRHHDRRATTTAATSLRCNRLRGELVLDEQLATAIATHASSANAGQRRAEKGRAKARDQHCRNAAKGRERRTEFPHGIPRTRAAAPNCKHVKSIARPARARRAKTTSCAAKIRGYTDVGSFTSPLPSLASSIRASSGPSGPDSADFSGSRTYGASRTVLKCGKIRWEDSTRQ